VVRDVLRRGDVEVDPPADDAGRHAPDRHVGDQIRVTALGAPAPPGDVDGQRDPDQVHQRVEVDLHRAEVKTADRRAWDERQAHARERNRVPPGPAGMESFCGQSVPPPQPVPAGRGQPGAGPMGTWTDLPVAQAKN
jgi:hypothetical protein